jgi:hypothetical protein
MIFLYSLLLVLIGSVRLLVERRAAGLGRTYSTLARAVEDRLREAAKPGSAGKLDPCQHARIQYELGQLVAKRDRVESRHFAWQSRADKLAGWTAALRGWKGKKLPYTLGAADVWLLLSAIDAFGVGDLVSARRVFDLLAGLLTF